MKRPTDHHRSSAAFESRAKVVENAGGVFDMKNRTIETGEIPRDYGPHDRIDPGTHHALSWFEHNGFGITIHGVNIGI